MSHYTVLKTRITDAETLVAALADLGFANVEAHKMPQPLFDWQGVERRTRAEIIVRRKYLRGASNDMGFARTADGTFKALISDYDLDTYGEAWMGRLTQRYAYRLARKVLAEQDYTLVEESMDDQRKIHMTVRRMA